MTLLGIIGDPIGHTLSPFMQNAALREMGLRGFYLPIRVRPEEIRSFLKRAKGWRMTGFNVTIPHKEKILPFLDRLSPEAEAIGAVNTVTLRGGRLIGDNTDGAGYLRSLSEEARFSPKGKRVVLLGAGGGARAILYTLVREGAGRIDLCNRTYERGLMLAGLFSTKKTPVNAVQLAAKWLARSFREADLLINATSVGLDGSRFKGLPFSLLPQTAVVSDLVYGREPTPFLREAIGRGLRTHGGLGMLLHQGALSLKIWTGKEPPIEVMKKGLLDALK